MSFSLIVSSISDVPGSLSLLLLLLTCPQRVVIDIVSVNNPPSFILSSNVIDIKENDQDRSLTFDNFIANISAGAIDEDLLQLVSFQLSYATPDVCSSMLASMPQVLRPRQDLRRARTNWTSDLLQSAALGLSRKSAGGCACRRQRGLRSCARSSGQRELDASWLEQISAAATHRARGPAPGKPLSPLTVACSFASMILQLSSLLRQFS
eukprot:768650-Hanusia_phi.AAC.5